jgi:F0F1-type ATP synthase delta subunit
MTKNKIKTIYEYITKYFSDYSLGEIVGDLIFVKNRFDFIGVDNLNKMTSQAFSEAASKLITDPVKHYLVKFLSRLKDDGKLDVFSEDNYNDLITLCNAEARKMSEIVFISAVSLGLPFKNNISKKLSNIAKTPIRVIFRVRPDIVSGFIIESSKLNCNLSLGSIGRGILENNYNKVINESD